MECGYGTQWAKLFWNKKGDWEINRSSNENRVLENISLQKRFACFCWRFSQPPLTLLFHWKMPLVFKTCPSGQKWNQNPFLPFLKIRGARAINDVFYRIFQLIHFLLKACLTVSQRNDRVQVNQVKENWVLQGKQNQWVGKKRSQLFFVPVSQFSSEFLLTGTAKKIIFIWNIKEKCYWVNSF